MAQALLSAELRLLAGAWLGRSTGSFQPSEDVLSEFDRKRRAIYREAAIFARLLLTLVRRPRLSRAALALLDRSPSLFTHLVGVAGGTRPLVPG